MRVPGAKSCLEVLEVLGEPVNGDERKRAWFCGGLPGGRCCHDRSRCGSGRRRSCACGCRVSIVEIRSSEAVIHRVGAVSLEKFGEPSGPAFVSPKRTGSDFRRIQLSAFSGTGPRHRLTVSGARSLRSEGLAAEGPPGWTNGWDRLLLGDSPGSPTIYAFTDAGGVGTSEIHSRLERLAQGLSSAGMLHGPPLRLVAVAVFPNGLGSIPPRTITGLTPSFYTGLRPVTWADATPSGRLHRGRWRSEGADEVEAALDPHSDPEVLDSDGIAVLERDNAQRSEAFYGLMRSRQPMVTYGLLVINVAIFLWMYRYGGPGVTRHCVTSARSHPGSSSRASGGGYAAPYFSMPALSTSYST